MVHCDEMLGKNNCSPTVVQKKKKAKQQKKAITFPFFICSSSELFFFNYKRYGDCDFFFLNYCCSIHSLLHVAVFCSWTTNDGRSWSNSC